MKTSTSAVSGHATASYAALRHEGYSPLRAQRELGLAQGRAARLERGFQRRPGGGADAMKPRFARHEPHVRAVLALGGYPVLRRP
jgi:hypothetical protein